MKTTTHDELREILIAKDVQRKGLINDFMIRRKPGFLRQAAQICQHFHLNRNNMYEDVAQIVAQTSFEMILKILDEPQELEEIVSFEAVLKTRAQNAVYQFLRSGAVTPMSGMGNVERRRALLARTHREMLAETGVEPSNEMLIAETNRKLLATNKDPKRSGLLVSEADLNSKISVVTIMDELDSPVVSTAPAPDQTGAFGFHIGERPRFLKLVRQRLSFHEDELIADMSEYWLIQSLEADIPTGQELADRFNIPVSRARSCLRDIKTATADVLRALNEEL